jgi:hypothetical protein
MDMVKDRLRHGRKWMTWALLTVPIAVGSVWLETGKARGLEADPAIQAEAGAKASAPASKPAGGEAVSRAPAATVPKMPPIIGQRDPFRLPGPPVAGGNGGGPIGPLPPGTRGLVISQLRLEGIVRLDTTNTMIAVVDTNANRAYFLRENDAVYNGVVAKITPDSVIFRENALDQSGQVYVREVVKRLGQGPGA